MTTMNFKQRVNFSNTGGEQGTASDPASSSAEV